MSLGENRCKIVRSKSVCLQPLHSDFRRAKTSLGYRQKKLCHVSRAVNISRCLQKQCKFLRVHSRIQSIPLDFKNKEKSNNKCTETQTPRRVTFVLFTESSEYSPLILRKLNSAKTKSSPFWSQFALANDDLHMKGAVSCLCRIKPL